MRHVSSRHNPLVTRYRDAAEGHDDMLLLDGEHLLVEATRSPARVRSVAVTHRRAEEAEVHALLERLEHEGADIVVVTEAVMKAMSPVRTPSGIVALAARAAADPDALCSPAQALVLALVDVQDPGNLGAAIRTAEAAGISGVLVSGASASPYSWKALRGSMGSSLRVPVVSMPETDAVLALAARHRMRTCAAVATGGTAPEGTDLTGRIMVVLGGEGAGLSQSIVDACDIRATIPMTPPVESLNVAVAGALLLYEARRQRTSRGH